MKFFIENLSSRWWILGVFVIALALRIAMTWQFVGLDSPPDRNAGGLDVVDYEAFAWSLTQGNGYVLDDGTPTARRAPGTSFALVPVYAVFGRSYLAAHLWFCVLSAATCAATAWLAELVADRESAVLAGLWLAVYPGSMQNSMHFFSEVPFALLLVLALGTTLRSLRGGELPWGLAAGICWGGAVLVRPNIVLAAPIGLLLLMLVREGRTIATLRTAGAIALTATLTVVPWVARNYFVMGKPAVATVIGGYTFWGANNEIVLRDPASRGRWIFDERLVDSAHPLANDEVSSDRLAWKYGLQFVREHVADMPGLIAVRLQRLLSPFEPTGNRVIYYAYAAAWLGTVPFVLYGMVALYRADRLATFVLLTPLLVTLITAAVFYGCIRFRDSVAPVYIVFAAAGLVGLFRALRTAIDKAPRNNSLEEGPFPS